MLLKQIAAQSVRLPDECAKSLGCELYTLPPSTAHIDDCYAKYGDPMVNQALKPRPSMTSTCECTKRAVARAITAGVRDLPDFKES